MVKRKINKSQKKSQNRRRPKAGAQSSGSLSGAPFSVSDNIRQTISFKSGQEKGSLCVNARVPFTNVCSRTSIAPTFEGGLEATTGLANLSYYMLGANSLGHNTTISESQYPWLSPVIPFFASNFVRYKVKKLKFIYMPQVAATENGRCVFAFAEDPAHPLVRAETAGRAAALMALTDSVVFAPWVTWELDVTRSMRSNILYVANQSHGTAALSVDDRFSYFGIAGCTTTAVATGDTPRIFGVIYMDIEIEFMELCPVTRLYNGNVFNAEKLDYVEGDKPEIKNENIKESSASPKDSSCYTKEHSCQGCS
jgi:hypothetical protein